MNFSNSTITIQQQIQQQRGKGSQLVKYLKTEKSRRVIALPEYMMKMLADTREQQLLDNAAMGKEWKTWEPDGEPHAFCFTHADGSILRPGYDTTHWYEILDRAGLPHTRRYTTRHTAISMAISSGDDPASVAEMAGHASTAMTLSVYTHAIEERKLAMASAAASRYEARMGAAQKDKVQNKVQQVLGEAADPLRE